MKRMRKRLLSLLLCFCMVAGLLPVTAGAADVPAITTETLEAATVNEPYTATLTATPSDAQGALVWSSEDLPDWLTLTDNGNGTATLTGTPEAAGEVKVTVKVTETILAAEPEEPTEGIEPAEPTVLTASKEYTLTVDEAASANEPEAESTEGTEPEAESNPGTKPEAEPNLGTEPEAEPNLATDPEAEPNQGTEPENGGNTRSSGTNIAMTVTKDGQNVTNFSNTDTIVITATLPTAPTSVTSVFFNDPAGGSSGENWLYLGDGIGNLSLSGSTVTITMSSLYKAKVNYVDGQWVESKGDPLPPGDYKISFWDDFSGGSTQYISNATYTVTPGGVEPGGEQGIYGADAFFTTQWENSTERILSRQPYAFYLYTKQPLTGTETATATVYYTPSDGSETSFAVTLAGTANGYVLSGRGTLDNNVTGTISKVTFQLGDDITDVTIDKKVISTVQVTFTGVAGDGVAKYLKVYDGDKLLETVSLGRDAAPKPTYVTVPSTSSLTFQVTGTVSGREVEYAKGTASDNQVTLTLADKELTQVTPSVRTDSNSTLASYQYTLKWYASNGEDAKPIATGSSYYLLPGETVYVQAVPASHLATIYKTTAKTAVSSSNTTPTLTLKEHTQVNVSGTVKLNGSSTPLSGVTITVTNTIDGSAVSATTTTGENGTFTLSTPVLEGAVLTASRGDLGSATRVLTTGQDNANIEINLSARKGVITLPQQNLFDSCTLKQGDKAVAFTTSGGKQYIYLTDDNVTGTLSLRLNTFKNTSYADITVTLDSNRRAIVSRDAITWHKRGQASFTLINPGGTPIYVCLYDGSGSLFSKDSVISRSASIIYNSPYLKKSRR